MTSDLRIDNGIDIEIASHPEKLVSRSRYSSLLAYVARLLSGAGKSQTKVLRHVETLTLGPKRTVFLIECDGQRFLLAEGASAPVPLTQHFSAAVREDRR